jgi:hypothetical protein
LLGVALLAVLVPGCPSDKPFVAKDDAGMTGDGSVDAPPEQENFTKFVIDLIENHSNDPAPAAYQTFKDIPDPDGDSNNTGAYSGLFQ